MRKFVLTLFVLVLSVSVVFTQGYQRKLVDVPKVDPAQMTIDGKMNEAAWANAARANLVTSSGFEMFTYPYYRPGLVEPEYDEYVGRMLWAKDTLYVFIHIDEFVNDSTDLYWNGQWTGDQLFVSLSNRIGVNMKGWYDGNVYAAPDGPFHFLILADSVTLNMTKETSIPAEYKKFPTDTTMKWAFHASDIARWGITINKTTGVWDVEMAIYNPGINADGRIAFNIGGSTGSYVADTTHHDAYAYYCWQPCVVDSPFAQPQGVVIPSWGADPGYYNLASSDYWPLLHFIPGVDDYIRKEVNVPSVDPALMTIDGQMNEAAWTNAARANLVTASGFEMYTYPYYRPGLVEPEYDEYTGRMLWAKDTLYVFLHIDEFVNDSTDLYWNGQWTGDQLFVSLSNRLGVNMKGWYDGNVYASPGGPYHFLILADSVTLNLTKLMSIPTEFLGLPTDTTKHWAFHASDIARWGITINKTTGVWNVEMAIYNPGIDREGRIAFNIGGSTGSYVCDTTHHDAYAYYCWVPSVIDSPFVQPPNVFIPSWGADPGYYNLASSDNWALLTFKQGTVDVKDRDIARQTLPASFSLDQNYPNPFKDRKSVV
jgi:hypothetical protein